MSELTFDTVLPAVRVQRTASRVRPGPLLAVTFLAFLIIAALVPQLFAHSDPLAIVPHDAFPSLVLALLFVASVGSGVGPLIVATGLGGAPGYARMVRGQVLAVRNAGYIEAAVALGHPTRRIILRQLLPNAMRPLIVTLTMGVGQAIVWASARSFLGLGAPPPAPEWGTMLSMGRDFVANAWWLTFFPGLFIVLTTLSTTVAGRYLQQRLEGRLS